MSIRIHQTTRRWITSSHCNDKSWSWWVFFSALLLFAFMEISWIEDEEEISRERAAAFMAPWRWRTTFMYQKIAPVLSSCSGIVIWYPPNSGGFQSDQMLIDFAGWHVSKVYRDPSLFGVSLSVFKLQGVLQAKLHLLLDVLTSRSFVACFVLCCTPHETRLDTSMSQSPSDLEALKLWCSLIPFKLSISEYQWMLDQICFVVESISVDSRLFVRFFLARTRPPSST